MDIFSYWDSGRDNAPAVVQKCFQRWEDLNPEHRLVVLNAHDLRDVLSDLPFDVGALPVQAQSDILRVRLLRLHGGAWVDATLLPVLPLDLWHDTYVGTTGFFVFGGPPVHWRLGTFLILAQAGNPFIQALDQANRDYWTHPRQAYDVQLRPTWRMGRQFARSMMKRGNGLEYLRFFRKWRKDLLYPVSDDGRRSRYFPYFWQHYLMMQLAETDPKMQAIVDSMTYRQYDLCHTVQGVRHGLGPDFPKAVPMALRCSPVQKLDWRVDWPDEVFKVPPAETVLI